MRLRSLDGTYNYKAGPTPIIVAVHNRVFSLQLLIWVLFLAQVYFRRPLAAP